nr:618_t:CDS:2 [Entrophospora candida]
MSKSTQSDARLNRCLNDIFLPDSRIEEVIMAPYEETNSLATKCEKELLKYNNYREKWRVVVKEKKFMSEKRHFTNAIRVYRLFKLVKKERIYNTIYLNSNVIGELSATDYKKLYDMIENYM